MLVAATGYCARCRPWADSAAVVLETADFERGSLQVTSYARPGKLFTASGDLVESVVGVLQPESVRKVIAAVVTILGGSR
jgi:mRNA interferase MazF